LASRNEHHFLLLLSGEHPTIPRAEACAILRAENVDFEPGPSHDQVLIVRGGVEVGRALEARAAMVMEGGELLASLEPTMKDLRQRCLELDWSFLRGRSFGVKVSRVKEHWKGLDTQLAQGLIGEAIISATDARVDLHDPNLWIRGLITDGGLLLFARSFQTDRSLFSSRKPKTRPYFHPGVLDPKLSRAFVNLSGVRSGETFIDPFCGTGGFLIEAALMGCRVCGMDLDPRMISGAARNIRHYGLDVDLIHCNAMDMPLNSAHGIACDPPYGRGSSTMGGDVRTILSGFFLEAHRVLDQGALLCTAAPMEAMPGELAKAAGFLVREEHSMRVHKSLTRTIIVAERAEAQ
jgi:tRNA (guanine10-N2)-dimethyltransferase